MENEQSMKPFIRPEGHSCRISTGIHDCPTFGTGELDDYGFWAKPCYECAREYEKQFPKCGFCWPFTRKQLEEMGYCGDETETNQIV